MSSDLQSVSLNSTSTDLAFGLRIAQGPDIGQECQGGGCAPATDDRRIYDRFASIPIDWALKPAFRRNGSNMPIDSARRTPAFASYRP